jgi:hypothetical protein
LGDFVLAFITVEIASILSFNECDIMFIVV